MVQMKTQLAERLKNIANLEGWCGYQKAKHLAQLILDRRPEVIVEIGVFGGKSLSAMAMACQHIYNGHCTGIDPWTKAAALEGDVGPDHSEWWAKLDLEQIRKTCLSNIRQLGLEDFITIQRNHDSEVLSNFEDQSIDLIHEDSNHSLQVSVRTCRDWVPKLKIGGLFIMDDSSWDTQQRSIELLNDGLGTKHVSTHDNTDEKGKVVGQYMLFERVA